MAPSFACSGHYTALCVHSMLHIKIVRAFLKAFPPLLPPRIEIEFSLIGDAREEKSCGFILK